MGIVLVIFWLLVTVGAIVLAATYGMRWLQAWLSAPEEAPLPPPDRLGAECVVWQFADQFVETVPKNQVPEWKRHRYTELKDGKLALTQPLAETMLLAAMAELWRQGLLQFRLAPKTPDPFDPHSLDTYTIALELEGTNKQVLIFKHGILYVDPMRPVGDLVGRLVAEAQKVEAAKQQAQRLKRPRRAPAKEPTSVAEQ